MRVVDFVIKEIRQMRRDKRLVMMMVLMPIIQLLLYGYAVTTDIRHLKTVICDLDGSSQSRDLVRGVIASPEYFDVVGYVSTAAESQRYLDSEQASVALVIPRRYSRDLASNSTGTIQVLLDGSDANAGTIAGSYLAKIVGSEATSILQARAAEVGMSGLANAGVDDRVQVWYNPTLESSFSLVPGVMCMIVGNLTMILSALAIVRERELGTIEQLLVTPIRSWELMMGKLIPYLLMGFIDVLIILGLATFLFGIPMRGGLPLLMGVAGLFMVGSLGLGLLVSTVAQTQMQASQMASFFLMPNMMLSGFMFPIENMPAWLQPVTYLLPMRYFLTSARGIIMKGNAFADLTDQIGPLALLSSAIVAFAILRFRKRLD